MWPFPSKGDFPEQAQVPIGSWGCKVEEAGLAVMVTIGHFLGVCNKLQGLCPLHASL